MGSYLPNTEQQRSEMLAALGIDSAEQLYSALPESVRLQRQLDLPEGLSELETMRCVQATAEKNTPFKTIFRGAGAYRHYIPAVVGAMASKETFVTAYTPYQAEISQGVLQAIFEYQTMICQLTDMEVANASVYDGASAAAEAAAMCRDRGRTKTLISACAPPEVMETVKTYCWAAGAALEVIPAREGRTDLAALESMLTPDVACVYLQQPNYFGQIEPAEEAARLTHAAGAKLVMGVNPIAAAILKTPGACGADIAVGEGQPLGLPLSFGGPYLGFMAASAALVRRLPGRVVGETVDAEGRRAFVLTLQAREQHIRREKAGSNICSNEALCALTAAVYLAAMGPSGLTEVAQHCYDKAHYLAAQLAEAGLKPLYDGPFFHEFVTECPADPAQLLDALAAEGILGGLPVEGGLLWCATEMNTAAEIDRVAAIAKGVLNA